MNGVLRSGIGMAAIVGAVAVAVSITRPFQEQRKNAESEERHVIRSLQGPELYAAYCAACHGVDGKGGGPAAAALKKTVPDLTRISQRNKGSFPAERVGKIISGEEMPAAAHGSREMPIWGPVFGEIAWDQDLGMVRAHNLAKYIESLQEK